MRLALRSRSGLARPARSRPTRRGQFMGPRENAVSSHVRRSGPPHRVAGHHARLCVLRTFARVIACWCSPGLLGPEPFESGAAALSEPREDALAPKGGLEVEVVAEEGQRVQPARLVQAAQAERVVAVLGTLPHRHDRAALAAPRPECVRRALPRHHARVVERVHKHVRLEALHRGAPPGHCCRCAGAAVALVVCIGQPAGSGEVRLSAA
mmetsp:Transcript_50539/g.163764  ORF Transcript_50539/g.163764 Transcript_50539/m.163764 type:complete len:210 (-) Transcript_50539:769-1398(-)